MFKHRTERSFWKAHDQLPAHIQRIAKKQYTLLEANPSHPSLNLKPVGIYWTARVTRNYRTVAKRYGDTFVWFWIGHHDEHDRIIKQ
jgi:hypothetical protein